MGNRLTGAIEEKDCSFIIIDSLNAEEQTCQTLSHGPPSRENNQSGGTTQDKHLALHRGSNIRIE